jgi:transcriptional regulator GlxA family with amidase domain
VDPSVLWRYQHLRSGLRSGRTTLLEVEESALAILGALVCAAYRPRRAARQASRQATIRRRRELVIAIQLTLASHPGAEQSLAGLARSVGCSPFHLTRVFREEVGIPVHRYLLRLRLAAAVERLANGERNLSALACDLGFSSHSHLTNVFRRTFGATPSGFRCPTHRARI